MKKKSLRNYPLILLAGGRSSRVGFPKGLIQIGGKPWVMRQIESFLKAGGDKVVVVIGFHEKLYREVLKNVEVEIVLNSEPRLGQFSSILCGIEFLNFSEKNWEGVFVLPVDVPCPSTDVLDCLVKKNEDFKVAIPLFQRKGGHPVFLRKDFACEIVQVDRSSDNARLDYLIREMSRDDRIEVSVEDSRVVENLNFPSDWARLRSTLSRE